MLFRVNLCKLAEKFFLLCEEGKVADKDLLIIGVGGVFSKEDFKEKISNGADLVQVYSGFVFEGPSLIKTILG